MVNHNEQTALKVVKAFKSLLTDEQCQQINNAQFDELKFAIQQALSNERAMIADQLEDLVKRLRIEVDKPELEL